MFSILQQAPAATLYASRVLLVHACRVRRHRRTVGHAARAQSPGRSIRQELVDQGDSHAAFADARSDPFHRSVPDVARRKDPRHARFEKVRVTRQRPNAAGRLLKIQHITPCAHVPLLVAEHLSRQPFCIGSGSDEHEQGLGGPSFARACLVIQNDDRIEAVSTPDFDDIAVALHPDVGFRLELLDEIAGHGVRE